MLTLGDDVSVVDPEAELCSPLAQPHPQDCYF